MACPNPSGLHIEFSKVFACIIRCSWDPPPKTVKKVFVQLWRLISEDCSERVLLVRRVFKPNKINFNYILQANEYNWYELEVVNQCRNCKISEKVYICKELT